jgi:hypothetical protein
MSTNKRQLRLTISAILESYNIDNLAVEGKLVDAVTMFFEQTGKGIDPVKVRGNILDGMLSFLDKQRQYEQMTERIAKSVKVTPNGSDKWNEIIRFCVQKEKEGQSIEKYGEWMIADKYNAPKVSQIGMNPQVIKDTWIAAFPDGLSVQPVTPYQDVIQW